MKMIYILRNGAPTGPFETPAICQEIQVGRLSLSSLAWHEGLPAWTELHNIPEVLTAVMPPPPNASVQPTMPRPLPSQSTAKESNTSVIPHQSLVDLITIYFRKLGQLGVWNYIFILVGSSLFILMLIGMVMNFGIVGGLITSAVIPLVTGGFYLRENKPKIAGGIVIALGIITLLFGLIGLAAGLWGPSVFLLAASVTTISGGVALRNRNKGV